MAYTTAFGLPQGVVDYLNEAYPDYSGMFPPPQTSPDPDPDPPTSDADALKKIFLDQSGENYTVYSPDPATLQLPLDPQNFASTTRDYGYPTDYFPEEKKGLAGILDKASKFSVMNFLGQFATDQMPVNETGIMQKALRQQGFALDNIGRIVVNPYDPGNPLNIMAGYTAHQMTPETFDKRIRNLKLTGDAYKQRVAQINAARKAWEEANRLRNIRTAHQRNLKTRKDLAGTGIQTNFDLGHGQATYGGPEGEFGGGIQSIQTDRSGGNIGSRVSSSYRDDPDTGLL